MTVPVSSLRNEALGYSGMQPAALKSITPGTIEGPAGLFSTTGWATVFGRTLLSGLTWDTWVMVLGVTTCCCTWTSGGGMNGGGGAISLGGGGGGTSGGGGGGLISSTSLVSIGFMMYSTALTPSPLIRAYTSNM
ncbi:hypothetical protein [Undibacterium sp. GrIS 1.2]|uniref:hypothetical protein n=2 Tax=unclassified Undibacterium TaxID=2630295 RepID=UPI0033932F7C